MPNELPTSIKELKAFIKSAGLSFEDCIDKSSLISRAKQAQDRLANSKQKFSPLLTLAGLSCKFFQTNPAIKPISSVAIILHGLGATNDDFVFLAQESALQSHQHNTLLIFPQAPMNGMMTAWWDLNPQELMTNMANQAFLAQFLRKEPGKFVDNRNRLIKLLEEVFSLDLQFSPQISLLLGGFSQGAITATDLTLHLPREIKGIKLQKVGLLILSGAPMMVDVWDAKLVELKNETAEERIEVFVTHGRNDMVLPFISYTWLRDMLQKYHGTAINLEAVEHHGGHDVGGPDTLEKIYSFLANFLHN
eukprot:maker-scaffold_3-snap-gene-3.4-mRNA-1 protein AED:0.00 eAED:0.00 QI:37/1/1/1/1/1/3/106/305